jgi:VanZ family protein
VATAWPPGTLDGERSIESKEVIEAGHLKRSWVLGLWQITALRWSVLALLLAVYAVLSLAPFDWRFPTRLVNGAAKIADGWAFRTPGIVIAEPPLAWLESARKAEALELSLEVRPRASRQVGPARMLTISEDVYDRNLTLAQDGDDLVLRLRSEDTDSNGTDNGSPVATLDNVLPAGKWITIDLGIRPGNLTIAIDGHRALDVPLPPSVLTTWNPSYGLALGNEMTCNRPWLGEIRKAVIAAPGSFTDYALAGQAEAPADCRIMRHPPKLVPFHPFYPRDALLNILMYLPLGCLLGLMARTRSARSFAMLVLATAVVSLTFESTQLFLVSRFPSIDDLIFNTLGGAVGIWLGLWLMTRLAPLLAARSKSAHAG